MQFDFLALLLFIVLKLVVILLSVGQRSKVFLPTPPSWLELSYDFFSFLKNLNGIPFFLEKILQNADFCFVSNKIFIFPLIFS